MTAGPPADRRRRPAPSATHKARGETAASRGVPAEEPAPVPEPTDPPGFVTGDALVVWDRFAPGLVEAGLLAPRYAEGFGIYCVAVVTMERSAADLLENGPTIEGRLGVRVTNPAGREFQRASEVVRKFGWEFGLTPSAVTDLGLRRGRAAKVEESSGSDAARFLQ